MNLFFVQYKDQKGTYVFVLKVTFVFVANNL